MAKPIETAAPARNFSLPTEERIGALVAGPPAYARRKRAIEDAYEALVRDLGELVETMGDLDVARREAAATPEIRRRIERLDKLIDAHNRYYPIEANLPIDPKTGQLIERGAPWWPLAKVTLGGLFAKVDALRTGTLGR